MFANITTVLENGYSRRYETFTINWQRCWDDAVKFISWQRPTVGHAARFAMPRVT